MKPLRMLLLLLLFAARAHAQDGLAPGPHAFQANGAGLWYSVGGKAQPELPPVVFLHGGPGQGSHTFQVMAGPYLESALQMVYFDQRGAGRSDRPASNDYAVATLVEDIEALRRQLGVPKIALMAHSFGGVLALEYAAKYPQHVSHLILVGVLYDAPRQCQYRREVLAKAKPEAYAKVVADSMQNGQRRSDCDYEFMALQGEEREAYDNWAMFPDSMVRIRQDSIQAASGLRNTGEMGRYLFEHGLLSYRFGRFRLLTMPVLVIAGKQDRAAGGPPLLRLAESVPAGNYIEYDGAGHFVYLDQPERFARDVVEFLHDRL